MCKTLAHKSIDPNGQPVTINIEMPHVSEGNISISYFIRINRSTVPFITGDNISISDDSKMEISKSPAELVGKLMQIDFYLLGVLDSKKSFSYEVFQGNVSLAPKVTHNCSQALNTCVFLFK